MRSSIASPLSRSATPPAPAHSLPLHRNFGRVCAGSGPMTLTTARHSDMGAGGSQWRYLTYMTSDPRMIEAAAFPALLLRLRDEVTSPLGALWLQALAEGGLHSKEHRRRSLSGASL